MSMQEIIKKRKIAEKSKAKTATKVRKKVTYKKPKISEHKTVTIEINFDKLKEIIIENKDKQGSDEYKIYKRVFKPYKRGNKTFVRGRDEYLWDAIKSVATKYASKIVSKITREEIL